jgi:RNA-binding protein 39
LFLSPSLQYSQFGFLQKVALQTDSGTGMSKGFCFLSFHDPKDANLAIQTMSGQVLAGRPMKTGWAVNKVASVPGAEISTSDEFPLDASTRTTNAYRVLAQLTVGMGLDQIRQALVTTAEGTAPAAPASRVPTVADARASLAVAAVPLVVPPLGVPENKLIGRGDQPTPCILVHNMYCKDEETEPGWAKEIKEEFVEECAQHGKILDVKVMSEEPGGKIYASFASTDGAQKCASSIAG